MVTYTLHVPEGAQPGDPEALERAELVKDGFAWGAFVFTFFWFLVQRLWLAALGVLIGLIALAVVLDVLDVHPVAGTVAQLLLGILIGLEANSLKRWTYTRRGRPAVAIVTASSRDEAEERAFTQWLTGMGPSRAAATPSTRQVPSIATSYPRAEPVIGMFPDAERLR